MLKHVWTVLCERVTIDKESGLVSYSTCVEAISGAELPAAPPLLALGSRWHNSKKDPAPLDIKLVLVAPDGKESVLLEVPTQTVGGSSDHRTIFSLNGIGFKAYGVYVFVVQQRIGKKWQVVAEIPINVTKAEGGLLSST